MTHPMEHREGHDWADASDQASQGKRTKKGASCEWYTCKNCDTRATKWLDNTFPDLKDKYVFNPSGGVGWYELGYFYPCEMTTKFRAFSLAAKEFLDSYKDVKSDSFRFDRNRFRERCVHLIMQSWVNECNHPEEYVTVRPYGLDLSGLNDGKTFERLSCFKCGGNCEREVGTDHDDDSWDSGWDLHEKYIRTSIENYLKPIYEL